LSARPLVNPPARQRVETLRGRLASPYLGLVVVTMLWGGLHPIGKLAIVTCSGIFGSLPWLAIATVNGDLERFFSLPARYWLILFGLGVIGTGLTYGLWTAALARLNASSVAVFKYAIPFWAVLLSVLVLGETVTIPLVLGGIGIVAGIAITQRVTQ